MKTNRILLGLATLGLLSCHQKTAIKARPCCGKEGAVAAMGSQLASGSTSIYQLTATWTDQHEKQLKLSNLRAAPKLSL